VPAAPSPPPALGQPALQAVVGGLERTLPLQPLPFRIGRRPGHELTIPLPQISRDHAQIEADGAGFALRDLGSTHGTLLNGERISAVRPLAPGDTIEFPNCAGVRIVFQPPEEAASLFLSQMQKLNDTGPANEFDRLRLLLDFSQRLRAAGGLEDILAAMLDAALRLTGAERGYVFLHEPPSLDLRLRVGRTAAGETLADAGGTSHSIVERAARTKQPVLMHDSREAADLAQSVVAYDLRTVLAIPLQEGAGVLYLDSHAASKALGQVSREMLEMLAHGAAQVVINAQLARRQEAARLMEKELALAATIQRGLMAAHLPTVAFARLDALSQACLQIGGDYYDALLLPDGDLALVLADVSGKGAAAALLAATLQGLVHAQLLAGAGLPQIAATANRFICERLEGEKYATLIIARLATDGGIDYINCGHVQPLIAGAGRCRLLPDSNLPVGLLAQAEYTAARDRLAPGERLLLFSDGVTEAANPERAMFGDARLEELLRGECSVAQLAAAVHEFCQGQPLADDLTVLEARFAPGVAAA
jgi:sigma-B regulation protein RsbU (phosphoserine phosphatase)